MLKIQSSFPLHVFQAAPNILSKISPTFIKIAAVALAAISTLFLAFIFYHDCQKYIKLQARLLAQKEIEQNEQEKELQEQENEQMLLKLQKKEQQEVDEKKKDRNEGSDQGHTNPQINIPQKTNNPQTNKVQNTWQIGNSLLNPVDPMKEKRKKEEEESLKLALSLEKEEEELQRVISISQLENASPTQQNKGSTTQVDPNTNIPLTLGQQGLKTDSRPTTTQLNTAPLSFHGNGQTTQTVKVDTSLTNSLVSQSLGCTVNDPKDSQEAGDVKDLYPKTNFNQQSIDKGSEISTSSSSSGQTQKNIDSIPLNSSGSGQTQNKTSFILHSLSGSGQTQKNIDSLLIDSLLIGSSSTQTIQTVKIDNSHTKNQVSKSLGCLMGNPNVFTNLLGIVNTKSQGAVDVNDLYSKTKFNQQAISNGGKIPSFIVLPGVFRNKAHWFETGEAIYSYHDILKNNDAEDVPLIVIKGLQINRVNDSRDYLAKAFLNRQITDMFPLKGKNVPLFPKDGVCDCFWFIVNDKDDIIMDLKDAQPRYGSHRYTQTEVDPCIEENEKEMSRLIDFLVKNAKGGDDPSISSSSSGQTQKQTDPTPLNSISSGQTQKQTDLFPPPPVIKIKDPFDKKSGLSIDTKSSSLSVGGSLLTQSNPNGNGQTIQTVKIDNSHIKSQQSMSLGCALESTTVFQNLLGAINNHSQGKVDVKDLYTKTCFDQQAISNGCKIPNFIAIQSVNRNKAHWHEIGGCLHFYFDILKNNHAANVPLIVVKGMQINRFKNPDHLTKSFLKREHADTIPLNNKNVPFFPINSVSDCFWFVVNDTDNVIMNRKDAIPRYGNSRFPDNEVDHFIEENEKEMSRLIDFLVTNTKGNKDLLLSPPSSGQTQIKINIDNQQINKKNDLLQFTKSSSLSIGNSLPPQSNINGNGQTIQTVKIDNSHTNSQQKSLGCALENSSVFQNLLGLINSNSQGKVDVNNLFPTTKFNQQAISGGCKIPNFIALLSVFRNKAHWHELGDNNYYYHNLLKNNHVSNVPLVVIRGLPIRYFRGKTDPLMQSFLDRKCAKTIPINHKEMPFFPEDSVGDCFWFIVDNADNIIMSRRDVSSLQLPDHLVDLHIEENKKEMSRLIDFLATKTNATSTNTNTSTTNTNVINSSNTTQGKTNDELLEDLLKDL